MYVLEHTLTEKRFLVEAARFGADVIDNMGKNEGTNKIIIWIEGTISLETGWKRMRLILDKANWQGPYIGRCSTLAGTNPNEFLNYCSLQYINKNEFPEWPKEAQS